MGLEVGAKVEILGEQGVYLVVRVDDQRYVADLMLMGKTARLEQGVSFGNIRPVAAIRNSGSAARNWTRMARNAAESPADD
jgi:hypothetical protein